MSTSLRRGSSGYIRSHWGQASGRAAHEACPCTHSLTPSTRLEKSQTPLFKFSVWPSRDSNPTHQLQWRLTAPCLLLFVIGELLVMWLKALPEEACRNTLATHRQISEMKVISRKNP